MHRCLVKAHGFSPSRERRGACSGMRRADHHSRFRGNDAKKAARRASLFIEGLGGKRLGTTSFSVIINEDRWNGLPDDIRKIFEDASGSEWHANGR